MPFDGGMSVVMAMQQGLIDGQSMPFGHTVPNTPSEANDPSTGGAWVPLTPECGFQELNPANFDPNAAFELSPQRSSVASSGGRSPANKRVVANKPVALVPKRVVHKEPRVVPNVEFRKKEEVP